MKHAEVEATHSEPQIRLIQVGFTPPQTVRELFEHLAKREGEIIQEARQRAMKRIQADSTG